MGGQGDKGHILPLVPPPPTGPRAQSPLGPRDSAGRRSRRARYHLPPPPPRLVLDLSAGNLGAPRRLAVAACSSHVLETTPTPNPLPTEEEKTESNQEVANPEHYIKHPLQNRWALWFFKNDKSKTWQANLRLISKFDTVEDFWALYNHIQLSSNLMPGCDYSLFKDGIEPMWEDEKNKRGGRWLITLNKQQRRSDLDRFWLETLLCLIGESFDDYSDDVCGAVVNVRAKGDKIAIWTTECENRDAVTHIGRVYKERLGLPPKMAIGYQSHADTATKSGSTTKNRFVV
ncbi:PREDICTED: eukaryotic translation initiation factor 4E-like [Chrysochloris asiatica]|uniref:Eukaryotic translation initiation factor 4E n=1 Tax=Chrysochloris asiatica TaxID=185453 RepID=A0A9B0TZ42_CHRAS|nr:PREDICTED: eukaryotic translation initiation factor 4E-like [Chrysochloris asiatica]